MKILVNVIAAGILIVMTVSVAAQTSAKQVKAPAQQKDTAFTRGQFVDKNNDGVCDNFADRQPQGRGAGFVDKNNDGVCDNFADRHPQGRGAGFVDKNNDGICDNRADAGVKGRGPGFTDQNNDGICDHRQNSGKQGAGNYGHRHRHGQGRCQRANWR
jgi:hypothetical protein